jgi:hypothetical protein
MVLNLNKGAIDLANIDYKAIVTKEIDGDRGINALFLIHGYIEAFLTDWLFIMGGKDKTEFTKQTFEFMERVPFATVLHIHHILGSFDYKLYKQINDFNETRNNLAHDLIKMDINDNKTKDKLKRSASYGIKICDEIFKLYKKELDKKQKKVTV